MKDSSKAFRIVALGCSGGPFESNLSSYLLSAARSEDFILIDGGTLLQGIHYALEKGALKDLNLEDSSLLPEGVFLHRHLKAILISHAHLDHIGALVVNSQVDIPKPLYGLDTTIDQLRDYVFNGKIWPNYGSEGACALNRYHYVRLQLEQKVKIQGTDFQVKPFVLSHSEHTPSTAFLVEHQGKFMLYFGDTTADMISKGDNLRFIWKSIAPLIREKKFHGMLLECSYSLSRPDVANHGHLDPYLMQEELKNLAKEVGGSIKGLSVVVTHRKESLFKNVDYLREIQEELTKSNPLGINWIFPSQGDEIYL